MNSVCDCRQSMITYHLGDILGKRYEFHLVSGKTGRYFRDKTILVHDNQEVLIFSCANPSCNTVIEMRDHIEEIKS